jgi:hypothetical protein
MSHHGGLLSADGREDLDLVSRPGLDLVAVVGRARGPPSTAGDPKAVEELGDLNGASSEDVRGVARPGS